MEQIDVSSILKPGVYLLSRDGRVVFIGRARCMFMTIYTHRIAESKLPAWFPIRRVVFDKVEVIPVSYDQTLALATALAKFHKCTHNLNAQLTPAPFPVNNVSTLPTITRRA